MKRLAETLASAFCVALAWVVLYRLNAMFFSAFEQSPLSSWIFLPAAVRIMAVLAFGSAGALGLFIGALWTMPEDGSPTLAFQLLVATSSSVAPIMAVWTCSCIFKIRPDLRGLRGPHIITLSVANAAANAVILNSCLALAGRPTVDAGQIFTVLVGDMVGAALVIFSLAHVLRLVFPTRISPERKQDLP